ncbi:MAG: B3/4 domain-containing protein [Ktedonobacteraceae bacterium]|jgi:DNA/RNA-binding domain of Phe-tRNA-synthetase-like protein
MNYQLKIDPRIIEKYPRYTALIVYARGLSNGPGDEYNTTLLRKAEQKQRAMFAAEKPASHPHIAAWREAYKSFGAKPNKFPCSLEALLSRVLKGHDLPTINRLVDIYNAVSIEHMLPVGGEDWDYLTSDLILTLASGEEPFGAYENGEEVVTFPDPGEVIWVDSAGVTCRRWNWRQCIRTRLTEKTQNVYFVLDRLAPYSIEALVVAGEDLMEHLKKVSPDCTITYELLGEH